MSAELKQKLQDLKDRILTLKEHLGGRSQERATGRT